MRTKYLLMPTLLGLMIGGFAGCKQQSKSDGMSSMGEKKIRYHCVMHPNYISDKPGNCPICNMRLVPMDDNADAGASVGTNVQGQGLVKMPISSEREIGVTVSPVEMRELFLTIKAPGRVAYDPNLYSAILEYQETQKSRSQDSSEGNSESELTMRASKLRLRQMGLSDQQIEEIGRPGFDPSNLLLGQAGGRVWVYVDIYDYESASVRAGQKVEFTSPAIPAQMVTGEVRAVDSIVNSETRTLRVRVEVANPRGDLKPEMYLSATIHASIGKKLAVPDTAVLDTGVRQLVYVQAQPGQYEPREIKVGREAGGYYEVLSGIKPGEMVVTSANFLIDSESKIRATSQGMR